MSILTSIGQGDRYFEEKLKKYGLDPKKVVINTDGSLDYSGDVFFTNTNISEIPFIFNKVIGSFYCDYCRQLLSLHGCPKEVGGTFDCSGSKKIINLQEGPRKVGLDYVCKYCNLETLEGIAEEIGRDVLCDQWIIGKCHIKETEGKYSLEFTENPKHINLPENIRRKIFTVPNV